MQSYYEVRLWQRLALKRFIRLLARRVAIFLLCVMLLSYSWGFTPTFSRYVEKNGNSFTLSSSKFYLTPNLQENELLVDAADSFTTGNVFTVANYVGSNSTTANLAYTAVLEENRATPLFDLYMDNGSGGKTICTNNTISDTLTGGSAHTNTHTLYFKLKNSSTPAGTYPVKVKLASSAPYVRTFNYTVNIQVPAMGIPLTSIGAISGSTKADEILTAGALSPVGATVTYQWQKALSANGTYTDIPEANSSTYTVVINDNNYYFRVKAIGTGNYNGSVTSTTIGPVIDTSEPITGIGAISGTPWDGQVLTAGALTPAGASVTYQWQKSNTVNGTYTNIPGAVSNTYTLTPADVDFFVKVVATGSGNYTGSASAYIGPVKSSTNPLTEIGSISGTTNIGLTLTAGTLSPSGATAVYQWQSCSTPSGIYTNIEGATSSTYTLTTADNGKYIKVVAYGTDSYSGTVSSNYTGPVSAGATPITAMAAISGTAQVEQTLTAGEVTPSTATVTYQWQISSSSGSGFVDIPGATSNNYTVAAGDFGKYIRVVATGSGTYSGSKTSAATSAIIACPLTAIGNITGTTTVGQTLTAGTVSPYGATVTYKWQSSSAAGGTYADINGATASTYTLVTGDNTKYIRVVATGTGSYSGSVNSAYTGPVSTASGTNITAIAPIIGITHVFGTLSAGTLSPYGATATYQWQRSAAVDGPYVNIPGATSKTYTLVSGDKGYFFKVVATGSGNYFGTVTSLPADPITACPVTAIARINGTAQVGQILTAGVLTPLEATATYQWSRANTADGIYTNIPGATSSTYEVIDDDNTRYLKVTATGTGSYMGMVTSAFTGPVTTTATTITVIGAISGTAQVGQTLTAGALTPLGATATYQWQRGDTADGVFTNIAGATSKTYTATADDYGHYFKVVATASGAYTGTATSAVSGPVTASPLTAISNIIGTTAIGQTLTAGTVTRYGATVNYQWQSSATADGEYTNISGATSSTYTLTASDKDLFIKVAVTGTGSYSGTVSSVYTGPVVNPWEITAMNPIGAISGATQVGETLTAGALTPEGATATYKWQKASAVDGVYSDIAGAISSTYKLTADDYNKYIRVVATGSGNYSGEVYSTPVGAVTACPLTGIGAISGTTTTGQVLTAGTLTPYGATATYKWMKSDAWDGVYNYIAGATASTYTLTTADQGAYIKVEATGSNAYSSIKTSAYTGPVTAQVTPLDAIAAIIGTPQVEQTLTAGALTPAGATATYQWWRSDSAGGTYTKITGATASTYKLTAADYNKYIKVEATGSGIYSGTKASLASGPVTQCPLTSIASIVGVAKVGNTLTAGELSPLGATATYKWYRLAYSNGQANPLSDTYTEISGATASTYTLTSADNNCFIKVVPTGSGAYNGSPPSSPYIGLVVTANGTPLTSMGEITGITKVGGTLKAGAIEPAGATATYQWQRSATPDGTYANIPGATSDTYATTASDRDCYIKVVATGSAAYAGEVISQWAGSITPIAITAMGSISGTTVTGSTLTAGTIMPYGATASYKWQRSSTPNGTYTDIAGAISSTYKLTTADNNSYIRVVATGSGAYSGTMTSACTGPVSAASTPITAIGAISGTVQVRQTLTAGALTPGGATTTYQWQRCATVGGTYTDILGATASTYTLAGSDYDNYIRVVATGSGIYSGTAISADTTQKVSACPITAIAPLIGTASEGFTLTAGDPNPAEARVAYQWYEGNQTSVQDMTPIAGATYSSLTLPSWKTKYVAVRITGTGGYSTIGQGYLDSIWSVSTERIKHSDAILITAVGPTTGIITPGNTLTAGALTPTAATATYQWYRCETENGTYAPIAGAVSSTYVIRGEDEGYHIKVLATGSGNYSGTVTSGETNAVVATLTPITAISNTIGTTAVGQTLTAGTLTPPEAIATYQWQRADTADGSYTNITGATSSTYTITSNDIGKYFKVVATGTGAYSQGATSNSTGPVVTSPIQITNMLAPTGLVKVGYTLTAGALTPAGANATYQWQIFTEPGGIYVNIAGATSSTFTLRPNEYNYYIRVIATGSGIYYGTVSTTTSVKVAKLEITAFEAMAEVPAGRAGSATYADATAVSAALPTTVIARTANGGSLIVPVITWTDTDGYNPDLSGRYTFTAVLGEIPDGYSNDYNYTATVEVGVTP